MSCQLQFWRNRLDRAVIGMRPWGWFWILLGVTSFLIQPGMLGADDRIVFSYSRAFVNAGFRWSVMLSENRLPRDAAMFLKHDFAWFVLQVLEYLPFSMLMRIVRIGCNTSVLEQFYMSALSVIPVWTAIGVGWILLRREALSRLAAAMTLAGVWAGGYGICFLDTTYLANVESLLICLQLLLLAPSSQRTPGSMALVGAMAGFTAALKLYALPCVAVIAFPALLRSDRRAVWYWIGSFCAVLLPIVFFKLFVPLPSRQYLLEFRPALDSAEFPAEIMSRILQAFFSPAYGLFLTMPFLAFALLGAQRQTILFKLVGFITTLVLTLPFPFWTGTSGIAGNRYMFPYVLVFLPEIGRGFLFVISKVKIAVLIVPILIIAFFPCLAYRHNVTFEYATGRDAAAAKINSYTTLHPIIGHSLDGGPPRLGQRLPTWDIRFHPAIFAWTQSLDVLRGKELTLDLPSPVRVNAAAVPPYSLVLRMLFLQNRHVASIKDDRIRRAAVFYAHAPQALKSGIFVLATITALVWLALLLLGTMAILCPSRGGSHP